MAVSISLSITQNSQDIAKNTSNVTVKVTASWTGGSNNRVVNASGTPQAHGSLTIDGTPYSFASTFNDNQTTSGSKVIFTKTVNVSHGSDGTKKLSCSASYVTGVSSGTVGASASKTLTTIPRKSTLSVGNGTLGTAQTLTVTEQASSFTHTIIAKCGSASTTICTKSTTNSHSFTPPLAWASQNTTGTSVSVTYTITTYNGDSSVGSNTYTKSCTIPSGVKPSCSVSVTDATSYSNTYGGFVQGLSKFKIVVTPTQAYGSPITSYNTKVNGSTYTSSSFTTGVIGSSGSLTVSATVSDKRGRSGTASVTKTVLSYSAPTISKLTVKRCDETGVDDDRGEYVQVSFNASTVNIGNKGLNTASYSIRYKKSSDSSWTEENLSAYSGSYSINNGSLIFEADSSSSYDVELTVSDGVNTVKRATTASTGFTLIHWNALGNGMGIGKMSEIPNLFDIGLPTRLYGGLQYVVLPEETDLNEVRTPGFYVGENVSDYEYSNCPLTSGTFTLEVLSGGDDGQVHQILTRCYKTNPTKYERWYYSSSWGEWYGGWIYPTLGSDFVMYGSDESANKTRYRKDGRMVEVRGIVKPAVNLPKSGDGSTTSYTIFTLPNGYRPNSPIYIMCQGSGNCAWLLQVNTNGNVTFSRYRNGDANATADTGTWLPFQVTYFADN